MKYGAATAVLRISLLVCGRQAKNSECLHRARAERQMHRVGPSCSLAGHGGCWGWLQGQRRGELSGGEGQWSKDVGCRGGKALSGSRPAVVSSKGVDEFWAVPGSDPGCTLLAQSPDAREGEEEEAPARRNDQVSSTGLRQSEPGLLLPPKRGQGS